MWEDLQDTVLYEKDAHSNANIQRCEHVCVRVWNVCNWIFVRVHKKLITLEPLGRGSEWPWTGMRGRLLYISTFFFLHFNFKPVFLKIYLFIHERHREKERQQHRQREKQAPCSEPDMGLDPGSPGSCPGLKVALNHWATWAAPVSYTHLRAHETRV